MKTVLEYGDRLISLTHEYSNPASPTGLDETTYLAGKTSSIDAALTLLPPGFWWRGGTCSVSSEVCVCPDHNDPKHRERLLRDYPPTNPIWDEGIEVELRPGSDHAFCRAFAAACLRARAQSEGEKE